MANSDDNMTAEHCLKHSLKHEATT